MNDGLASAARADVLEFYRELPFNYRSSVAVQADAVRQRNALADYPPLAAALAPGVRLLDVGSGAGWLVNSAAFHFGCTAHGIDFNPVAVARARAVAAELGTRATFEVADLFRYHPAQAFDVVSSVGVLHHTDDCIGAIRHLAANLVAPGGRLFIGLYHLHGRRPFLQHFADMRAAGRSEDDMFAEFSRLRGSGPAGEDEVFLRSWFRDQVLHPHETQHTLEEICGVLDASGLELESTSVNRFQPLPPSRQALFREEAGFGVASRRALADGRYYPGFFVLMARKPPRATA